MEHAPSKLKGKLKYTSTRYCYSLTPPFSLPSSLLWKFPVTPRHSRIDKNAVIFYYTSRLPFAKLHHQAILGFNLLWARWGGAGVVVGGVEGKLGLATDSSKLTNVIQQILHVYQGKGRYYKCVFCGITYILNESADFQQNVVSLPLLINQSSAVTVGWSLSFTLSSEAGTT